MFLPKPTNKLCWTILRMSIMAFIEGIPKCWNIVFEDEIVLYKVYLIHLGNRTSWSQSLAKLGTSAELKDYQQRRFNLPPAQLCLAGCPGAWKLWTSAVECSLDLKGFYIWKLALDQFRDPVWGPTSTTWRSKPRRRNRRNRNKQRSRMKRLNPVQSVGSDLAVTGGFTKWNCHFGLV